MAADLPLDFLILWVLSRCELAHIPMVPVDNLLPITVAELAGITVDHLLCQNVSRYSTGWSVKDLLI